MNIIQPYIYIYTKCSIPHLLYPFIYRWALRLVLYLGYCKKKMVQ